MGIMALHLHPPAFEFCFFLIPSSDYGWTRTGGRISHAGALPLGTRGGLGLQLA